MVEVATGVVSTLMAVVGFFYGIHQKKKAEMATQWSEIKEEIDQIHEKVIEMEQYVQRTGDRLRVVERDTEKLETTVEKELNQVNEKLDKLNDYLFEIISKKSER